MRGRAERGRETDEVNERETLVEKRERKLEKLVTHPPPSPSPPLPPPPSPPATSLFKASNLLKFNQVEVDHKKQP